jgi:hypothetical protein
MLQRWWVYGLVMGALLLPILTSTPVQAQDAGLAIDIDPESASPDTIVKISGHGAPANTPILVLYAPWNAAIHCRDGRHAALVAEVTADAQGQFSATHVAQQVRADQAGYTYLAKLATPGRENQDQSPTPSALPSHRLRSPNTPIRVGTIQPIRSPTALFYDDDH